MANGSSRALRVTIALSFRDGWGGKEAKRLKSWTQQAGGGDGDERAEDGVAARLIHQVRSIIMHVMFKKLACDF